VTNPKISTLCDHFDQGAINTDLWSAPAGGSLGSIQSYGVASILTPTPSYGDISFPFTMKIPVVACSGATVGIVSNIAYDLTDSGVSVQLPYWTRHGTYSAGFALYSGSDYIGFILNNGGGIGAVDSNSNGNTLTYTASTFAYLRIRENSGTVYWDYSADGVNWTNAFSEADPFALTGVTVNLYVTGSGTPVADVGWANVNYVL
jgi:hypothetical protein